MQPGFWLSFVAVGVLFADRCGAPAAGGAAGAAARLAALWREQWVVTLALTPLALLLFQQVSAGRPGGQCGRDPLGHAGGHAAGDARRAAAAAVGRGAPGRCRRSALLLQWLAALPLATLSMPAPPLWAGGRRRGGRRAAGDAAAVVGCACSACRCCCRCCCGRRRGPPPGEFELLAADIGQGNAVLVRTATPQPAVRRRPALQPGKRCRPPRAGAAAARLRRAARHRDAEPPRQRPHRRRGRGAGDAAAGRSCSARSRPSIRCRRCARPSAAWPASAGTGMACASSCCIRRRPTTRGRIKPNALSCVLRIGQRPRRGPAGRRHRARCRKRALVAAHGRGPARRPAAGAAPRQQDLVEPGACSTRCTRASRWSRPATATASAIRPPR